MNAPITAHDLTLRFWGNVNFLAPNGCWEWMGFRDVAGYGKVAMAGRASLAHRVSLSAATGVRLGTKRHALHSCDNPPCVNPAHLRWGTPGDNTADKFERGRAHLTGRPKQSHCRKGHALVEGNLYYSSPGGVPRRTCRTCLLEWQRQSRIKKKTEALR